MLAKGRPERERNKPLFASRGGRDVARQGGAKPTACGWIKDPFGLSWQIVPRRFIELIRDKDSSKVKAVMEAKMTMVKLDAAALDRAYNEA